MVASHLLHGKAEKAVIVAQDSHITKIEGGTPNRTLFSESTRHCLSPVIIIGTAMIAHLNKVIRSLLNSAF